jgi:hypothetical protein
VACGAGPALAPLGRAVAALPSGPRVLSCALAAAVQAGNASAVQSLLQLSRAHGPAEPDAGRFWPQTGLQAQLFGFAPRFFLSYRGATARGRPTETVLVTLRSPLKARVYEATEPQPATAGAEVLETLQLDNGSFVTFSSGSRVCIFDQ